MGRDRPSLLGDMVSADLAPDQSEHSCQIMLFNDVIDLGKKIKCTLREHETFPG